MEAGQIRLEFDKVDVQSLVEHVRSIFKSQVETKSVELAVQLSENLPPVRADVNKLAWVLSNLISNALRYVECRERRERRERRGHILITAQKIGMHVHISVIDNGQGIPLVSQSKIFEKFVQVKEQESEGTGLGLAICKEIIRAHGGTIWVQSNSGEGCTFTFTVPVNDREYP